MRVLVKEGESVLADLSLSENEIAIGSRRDCDIHLPDFRVAACHARLQCLDEGRWQLSHVGQNAHSMVNGRRHSDPVDIQNGDQVVVGDYTLNIYLDFEAHEHDAALTRASITIPPLPPASRTRVPRSKVELSAGALESSSRLAITLAGLDDLAAVLDHGVRGLVERFELRGAWIGMRQSVRGPLVLTQGLTRQGERFDHPKYHTAILARVLERGLCAWAPLVNDADANSFIVAPLIDARGCIGVIYADSPVSGAAFQEGDLDHLVALAQMISVQLEIVMQNKARSREAAQAAASSVVDVIQAKLDPHTIPEWEEMQVAVHRRAGSRQSGDLYDVMRMPNGAAALLVGHIRAEETHAAISMIEVRTAFRIAVLHSDMPHVMLRELVWLMEQQHSALQMDCAILMVDPRNGAMLHCAAGNVGAIVVNEDAEARLLSEQQSPALSQGVKYEYVTRKGLLGIDESFLLYTPGVLQVRNSAGDILAAEALHDAFCDGFGMSARAALDDVLGEIAAFSGSEQSEEDLTLLTAHRLGEP